MTTKRAVPADVDAERAVLGAAIDNGAALADVAEILTPEDFLQPEHREIYRSITHLYGAGKTVDTFLLADELSRREMLHKVNGKLYLHELVASYSRASAAREHAMVIRGLAQRRRLIQAGHAITDLGYVAPEGAEHAVDESQRLVYEITASDAGNEPISLAELVAGRMHTYEELEKAGGGLLGLPSGFPELDGMTRGFKPGQFVIVAARPGMGKSAWMVNVATHIATTGHGGVAVFSLEMSRDELIDRVLSSEANVHASSILSGKLASEEWKRLSNASGRIAAATMQVDDRTDLTIMQLRSRCRRMKARGELDLIVVDYLQLMIPPDAETRQQQVAEISRAMKLLGRDLEVPVICAAQLSRNLEYRSDKRPVLADLRESGALEADADIVLFLYRDEVYNPGEHITGATELIVAKHRNGPTGSVGLLFESQFARFTSKERIDRARQHQGQLATDQGEDQ